MNWMHSDRIADVAAFGLVAAYGLVFVLISNRIVGSQPGARKWADAFHRRSDWMFRYVGWIVLAAGLMLMFLRTIQNERTE